MRRSSSSNNKTDATSSYMPLLPRKLNQPSTKRTKKHNKHNKASFLADFHDTNIKTTDPVTELHPLIEVKT